MVGFLRAYTLAAVAATNLEQKRAERDSDKRKQNIMYKGESTFGVRPLSLTGGKFSQRVHQQKKKVS